MTFQSLTLLGSTGSIGRQTLDVVRHLKGRIAVTGLSAGGRDLHTLAEQIIEFQPAFAHIARAEDVSELREKLRGRWSGTLLSGEEGLSQIAAQAGGELVLVATVGWTGLAPTLAALEAGRTVAIANKEALVCGGELVMHAARRKKLPILPVDSEHCAIFQCLQSATENDLRKIILTCSGGPLLNSTQEEIDNADRDVTLKHPRWEMGDKITIDSATLMNKGFEVIEAHHLFAVPYEKIEVVIHPQSIVHSMVEFVDGSVMAQLGPTDMRLPIQHALTYPDRVPSQVRSMAWGKVGTLTFGEPDTSRFPALRLAYAAGKAGGSAPCVLNAANEVAVQLHLGRKISCGAIPRILQQVMDQHEVEPNPSLAQLRHWNEWSRRIATEAAMKIA